MEALKKYAPLIAVGFLLLVHVSGIFGMNSADAAWFLSMTPLNLLLTAGILILFHKPRNLSFFVFIAICFMVGFSAEAIGVNTGLLFGDYWYGDVLGPKVLGVPLIIGVNWWLLVYISGIISLRFPGNWLVKALLGSGLLILLDYFIEPVAMKLGFWDWADGIIPLSNFIGWYGVGLILMLIFHKTQKEQENPIAIWVFVIQLGFFLALNALL